MNAWSGSGADGAIMPPLLKADLLSGAWVCGEPSFDEEFGVADLMVLLGMRELNNRYFKHFLGRESKAADQVDKHKRLQLPHEIGSNYPSYDTGLVDASACG